ncbi:hypothetical protein Tco_1568914 [Tanacetum coccineum]
MAEIGCNWARIGPSKSSQSLSRMLSVSGYAFWVKPMQPAVFMKVKMPGESLKKEKMYVKVSNKGKRAIEESYLDVEESNGNEPILAFAEGAERFRCIIMEAAKTSRVDFRVLMPQVVKSRDEIFSRWGYYDNHDLSRFVIVICEALLEAFGKLSISDQLEWIYGMLHGLVINWSSTAIETSRNRVNVFSFITVSIMMIRRMLGKVAKETLGIACGVNRISYGISTRSDADLRRLVLFTSLERQEVWNDCRSCKVRVGSNGNLWWEASVLLGRKKGCVMDTLKFTAMPFGLTNAPVVFMELMRGVRVARKDDCGVTKGREDVREVFQQRGSGAKRKLSRCGRNQMGNEPILALPEGAYNFVVLMKDCMTNVMLYRGVGRRSEAKNEFKIDKRRSDLEMESGSYWLDKVRTSIWRDVRTLAIEEAYTTKYSIHTGADTMLCGFRLTNRWLSMKKDIASCGSKYLAYLEVEVEYQGSLGLLLQPELPE